MNLADEVVLVTGGAQGLGEAMARACAQAGAAVIIADINSDGAAALAQDICAAGGRAQGIALDVTSPSSIRECLDAAQSAFGFVSVLINSAMYARYGPVEEIDVDVLDRMLSVGLKGVLLMCGAVTPGMRDRRHGVIINISSVVGLSGVGYSSAYAALKGGTDAITRALGVELGAHGIRVNSIAPSAIPTEMSRRTLDAKGWEERRRRTPLGVIGSVEDVAQTAVFLASAGGRFISGATLPVDGGFSIATMIPGVDIAAVQRSEHQPVR
jgi:NAD(P)-dependent dehydrogenase (short-subunit alcohol dehydrogenase family)